MNIGVAKSVSSRGKTVEMANGRSCTTKTQYLFITSIKINIMLRFVWREPHSAIPWLCYCLHGGQAKLARLVSLNKVQPILSQICDYRPLSVNYNKSITYGNKS